MTSNFLYETGYTIVKLLACILLLPAFVSAQSDSVPNDSSRRPSDFYVDLWDDEFEMADYLRVDFFQDDMFYVALNELDSIAIETYIPTPRDSHQWYGLKVQVYYPSPDSIYMWDHRNFVGYSRYNDSLPVDSIYFQKEEYYHHGDLDHYTMSGFCQYKKKIKHGREVQYYSVHELDGVLITGIHYRKKTEGHWKAGNKSGKWFYYSKNGELARVEKWRNGRLKRTRLKH